MLLNGILNICNRKQFLMVVGIVPRSTSMLVKVVKSNHAYKTMLSCTSVFYSLPLCSLTP